MGVARKATVIAKPVEINSNEPMLLYFYSDGARKVPKSVAGKTLAAKLKDPAGTWKSYSVTLCTALVTSTGATAAGRFTLTGASHTTTGDATIHVHSNSVLVDRFTFEFVEQSS